MLNYMQAQWVCSRERRIALYKRSSIIDQNPACAKTYYDNPCETSLLPRPSAWTPISSCLCKPPTTILVKSTCFQDPLHGHPFYPTCANHLPQASLWNQSACFQDRTHGHPFHPACAHHLPQSLWNQPASKTLFTDTHFILPVHTTHHNPPCETSPLLSPHLQMPDTRSILLCKCLVGAPHF